MQENTGVIVKWEASPREVVIRVWIEDTRSKHVCTAEIPMKRALIEAMMGELERQEWEAMQRKLF